MSGIIDTVGTRSGIVGSKETFGGCKVTLTSAQTVSTSGKHKILWDSEIYDTLNEFASNKYTATVAGVYLLTTTLQYADMGDKKDMTAEIWINNSVKASFDHKSSSANYESVACTVTAYLSISDYVEVFTDHAHGSDRDVVAGESISCFCVQRLS
tara:strand:- start:20 stop:484 length:465 start_codon:yes stop_codon:yes gene_type:complete